LICFVGNLKNLPQGEDTEVIAITTDEFGNSLKVDGYQWYLDGEELPGETKNTIVIGSELFVGTYWLDLMVTKGSIISSGRVVFEVVYMN
jgi:hypothetical protein